MQMNMRERIAAAISPRAKGSWDEDVAFALSKGRSEEEAAAYASQAHRHYAREYNWPQALRDAERALQAMREPTEEQAEAGRDELTKRGCNPVAGDAEAVWQAMIDAAGAV